MTRASQLVAIVGATGKVGYTTATTLLQAGVPVRAILRNVSSAKALKLREAGCELAQADIQDTASLASAMAGADAVQIILPPPIHSNDTAADMLKMIESLALALEKALPRRVLAISDYGAHVGQDIGMPTLFRSFEQRVSRLQGQKVFLRSAPHMEAWGRYVPAAVASGTLRSLQSPADVLFPTVSAFDVGRISASILLRPDGDEHVQVVHAEGPRRYSAADVAVALGGLLGRTVDVKVVPRSHWRETLGRVMNPSLAEVMVRTNDAQNKGGLVDVESDGGVVRGATELNDALRAVLPRPKM